MFGDQQQTLTVTPLRTESREYPLGQLVSINSRLTAKYTCFLKPSEHAFKILFNFSKLCVFKRILATILAGIV